MQRVHYESADGVARVRMDDGKVNVMGPPMQQELRAAFARAAEEEAIVILSGREKAFSAGFDLKLLQSDPNAAASMFRGGFELAELVLQHPYPVIGACRGSAIAMGLFLLLSTNYRVAAEGAYRLTANEVAIGMTIPHPAITLLRHRSSPAVFERAATLSEVFTPPQAEAAQLIDRVVPASELDSEVSELAARLKSLDMAAHAATKRRCQQPLLSELRASIEADFGAA